MKKFSFTLAAATAVCAAVVACTTPAEGNADAGKKYFEEQCIACHVAEPDDGGGMQGPSLIDLVGRSAGTDPQFPYYSKPLRDAGITWDATSLDRFLAAPDQAIPGTAMVLSVPEREDRVNLIAYFERAAIP